MEIILLWLAVFAWLHYRGKKLEKREAIRYQRTHSLVAARLDKLEKAALNRLDKLEEAALTRMLKELEELALEDDLTASEQEQLEKLEELYGMEESE